MAPSPDTPDFRRAVVSPQQFLAAVATPGTSVTVTIPPNTQVLVVTCEGGSGTITATATGAVTGLPYPGTQLKQGTGTGSNVAFHFNMASAIDERITVAVSGSPNWWVYADHARHAVIYPAPAPPPSGAPIVFCQEDANGYGQVCVINFDGTGFTQLTSDTNDYNWARWRKDGLRLLVADTSGRLWVLTPAGALVRQLTNLAANPDIGFYQGDWSPNGSQVVVVGTEYGSGGAATADFQIVQADNSGHAAVVLSTKMALWADAPISWSPDGTKFLYPSQGPGPGGDGIQNATSCLITGASPTNILSGTNTAPYATYLPWRWYPDSTNILTVRSTGTSPGPGLTNSLIKSDGTTSAILYTDTTNAIMNIEACNGAMDPTQTEFVFNRVDSQALVGVTGGVATSFNPTSFISSDGLDWLP